MQVISHWHFLNMEYNNSKQELSNYEIDRYSRQLLLPNVGIEGQLLLKRSSVLVVGAGGLGCPSSLYLSTSGIGHIGLIDYDTVELNNLHRQVLHEENLIGTPKVQSAARFLKNINPQIIISEYPVLLNNSNALDIISKFDVVVDATDNVATRYLLNDACVLLSKPLVSGSALQMEGQLTVYNHDNGPCYRCIFPVPPPPETITNCGEGGVLGVIPGTIGVLQALEVIKIILKQTTLSGYLLLFDGSDTSFRKIRLRPKNSNCEVCGSNPTIKKLIDYEQFCKSRANDKTLNVKLLPLHKRITAVQYNEIKSTPHVLIDVRSNNEFKICKLPNSVNIPINKIDSEESTKLIDGEMKKLNSEDVSIYVVCRRGNDSQIAALKLSEKYPKSEVKDIVGGLHSWSKEVDLDFPVY